MIPKGFVLVWEVIAPAVADHLWQSTLCVIIAGLLALALRNSDARVRYWLWLAASIKFLIPFSFLVTLGSYMAIPAATRKEQPAVYSVMEQVSQPFRQRPAVVISPVAYSQPDPSPAYLIPMLIVAMWLCGFVAVLCERLVRWRRASQVLRGAVQQREGREVDSLRRVERMAGIRKRIGIRLSPSWVEPGIFGIVRPVLLWPAGISENLDDGQLAAILAHEVWHVRCRDNLTAVVPMVVEAVFWFHPLVWWLGRRLLEERERACDEAVLKLGSSPHVYAESILKTCELCVSSPQACTPGITGSDLNKRIVRIMTERIGRRLNLRNKILLGMAGFVAIAAPIAFGLTHGRPEQENTPESGLSQAEVKLSAVPKFNVISIKLYESDPVGQRYGRGIMNPPYDGSFYATDVTVNRLVRMAYGVRYPWLIMGAPKWINSERFDVKASADSDVNHELKKLSRQQGSLTKTRMLQALLAERFQLKVKHETKRLPVYALTVAKHGPKFQGSTGGGPGPDSGNVSRWEIRGEATEGQISAYASMTFLADFLSQELTRTVVDRTKLKGGYNFTLRYRTGFNESHNCGLKCRLDRMLRRMFGSAASGVSEEPTGTMHSEPDGSLPSIFSALPQQLGLKLKPEKRPVNVLVVEHIEQPPAN
jgi:bla regulator protein blaR1